ncbi:hypothetical protein N7470_006777 [Penicillium chermesinum]|nr:hypothetical protein N7470_006777 [Penicillium chermesinum]
MTCRFKGPQVPRGPLRPQWRQGQTSTPLSRPSQQRSQPQPPLPPTAAATDKIKRLIATGRAYLSFYKTGLKNVLQNYRASIPHRETLNLPKYRPTSPPQSFSAPKKYPDIATIGLTRSQYQLVRRSARDVRRLIPFTLVLIICGEFTAIIVPLYGSAITPTTCRLPYQIAKERTKASQRKTKALEAHSLAAAVRQKSMPAPLPAAGSAQERALLLRFADPRWAAGASAAEVLRACAVFGLVGKHDRFEGIVARVLAWRLAIALDERGGGDVAALYINREKEGLEKEREWLDGWLDARKRE